MTTGTMTDGAQGVVQLLAASANASFADKIAAALLRAGYRLDPGAFDPARIDAAVVLWTGVALDKPELVGVARQAWQAGRLAPVSIGRIEPPFGAADAAPMDLAGWSGEDDDPRWRFVLSDLAVIKARKGAVGGLRNGDLAAHAPAPHDDVVRVYHPARQLWRRRIRPSAAPLAAGVALIGAAGLAAFAIGARSDPEAPPMLTEAPQSQPPSSATENERLEPPQNAASLAFVQPTEDFEPQEDEPALTEGAAAETLAALNEQAVEDAAAQETPGSLTEPPAQFAAILAPRLKPAPANDPQTEEIIIAAELNQQALEALAVRAEPAGPAPARTAGSGDDLRECPDCPAMAVLGGGAFMMGAAPGEAGQSAEETPQRRVEIGYRFAIAARETTFDQWNACVADGGCQSYMPDDAGWGRGDRPVINVSYEDASAYARWLSAKTGQYYRLPSEAEWEYAARAGTGSAFSFGAGLAGDAANVNGGIPYNAPGGPFRGRTVPVTSFAPNGFGLYNMHGNVWEWTSDCWSPSHHGAPATGAARIDGDCSRRVIKGGAWDTPAAAARSAHREGADQLARAGNVGFRVVRVMD